MDRTLVIRHNWHNRDESKWLFWLEKKLQELGFAVSVADLPDLTTHSISQTVDDIQATHNIAGSNVYVVRYDPGCLTLLKYCEQLLARSSVEPTLLVAGIPKKHSLAFPTATLLGRPGDYGYEPEPENLTLQTIDVKLMVVYGGELVKALPARK